jgi:transposase
MGDLFLLRERQMARISPYFPLAHGVPRVDDRRVVSGIVYVIRNGSGRMPRRRTGPTRRSTTGSCAGAGWASSTGSWPRLPVRVPSPSGS